jgi:hypothetical protein
MSVLNDKEDIITAFTDLVTLLYHEGRNVRHLVKNGKPIDSKFLSLRDRLSTNRYQAWKQIQHLRLKAGKVRSSKKVKFIFEQYFKLTLDELIALYAHPSWKGTFYGGNAWLPLARKVKEASELLDSGSDDEANCLICQIMEMSHNTGKVNQKLKDLDSC